MGRDAHLVRAMLGRGATEAPVWEALSDQYERASDDPVQYVGSNPDDRITYRRTFDAKGRPCDLDMRDNQPRLAEAYNHVISLMRHNAALPTEQSGKPGSSLVISINLREWSRIEAALLPRVKVLSELHSAWAKAYTKRIFTFGASTSTRQDLRHDWLSYGPWTSIANSLPTLLLHRMVILDALLKPFVVVLYDVLHAKFPSASWTWSCQCFELLSHHVLAAPFLLSADLQDLRLLPVATLSAPMPLLNVLAPLSRHDLLQIFCSTIVPYYILFRLLENKLRNTVYGLVNDPFKECKRITTTRASLAGHNHNPELPSLQRIQDLAKWQLHQLHPRRLWRKFASQFRPPSLDARSSIYSTKGHRQPVLAERPSFFIKNKSKFLVMNLAVLPLVALRARCTVKLISLDPVLSRVLPGSGSLSSFSILPRNNGKLGLALGSSALYSGRIAMTLLLQASIWTVLAGIESCVALFGARLRSRREEMKLASTRAPDNHFTFELD